MFLENYHSPERPGIVYRLLQFFPSYIYHHFKFIAESRIVNQNLGKNDKMMSIDRDGIMANLI